MLDFLGKQLETMKRLNRRSFLTLSAGAASALASPALAALPGETDVVIVGAGAAGIAAARKVAAAGRRFVILEASGRVGGRVFTETRTFGVPYDRGAHTIALTDLNPVAKLAARAGMDVYPVPVGQKVRIGRRYAREGEMEDFLAGVVRSRRAIGDITRGNKPDVPAARLLQPELLDWRPAVEFMLGAHGSGADLDEMSALDFIKLNERGDDSYCRQGYGALLAKIAQGVPVELSTPVTRISTDRNIEIETPRGRLTGRAAIVTVPIGVLASGAIRFTPEPKRQFDSFARLKPGAYERIALEMPGNPLQLQRDEIVLEKSESNRTALMLANVSDTSLAYVDVGGRFARGLAAQGEAAMVDFATEWLGGLYGTDMKKLVKRTHATQWTKDPLALGSHSFVLAGGQFARKAFMEPIRDRVFFAGEAAHETLWGTVPGAWESGERAADAALRLWGSATPRTQKPRRS